MPTAGFYLMTGYTLAREAVRKPDLFLSGVSPMELSEDGTPQVIVDIYK